MLPVLSPVYYRYNVDLLQSTDIMLTYCYDHVLLEYQAVEFSLLCNIAVITTVQLLWLLSASTGYETSVMCLLKFS